MSQVTIYTLAKELNMTPAMVSRAFNPDAKISESKRQIVLEAAKKYDFFPNKFASRLSMKTVTVGILINTNFAVNTEKMLSGIKSAYEKLKDYKVRYDVTVLDTTKSKLEDYKKALSKYKNFDGIILSGMSTSKYTELINDVYKSNKNIVQVQSTNKEVSYLFESRHNEEISSFLAAEFLYNCLRRSDSKNILLFTGDKKSTLHSASEIAFKNSCSQFGLNLLDSIDMMDDEDYLEKIIPDVFLKYGKKADGIYITSGLSAPICRYLEKNALDIPFVAFDTYEVIKTYMQKGIVSAAIAQNVAGQMETAFEELVRYLIMGTAPQKTLYTDVQIVLKGNMHQFD